MAHHHQRNPALGMSASAKRYASRTEVTPEAVYGPGKLVGWSRIPAARVESFGAAMTDSRFRGGIWYRLIG